MVTLTNISSKTSIVPYLIKVLLGSTLIAASAQISIPFYPVPMTMQAAALMVIGLVCTPSLTVGIVAAYILEAALGLPVLSNFTGGFAHLFGTRAGYIFGFLPLAFMTSLGKQIADNLLCKILGCISGNVFLYATGVAWLSTFIGFEKALQFGLYPFLWEIPLYIIFSIVSASLIQRSRIGKIF